MITLFSAPKPFTDKHIATIQRNAIQSWLALGNEVEVLLMGDEPGLAPAAVELNVPLLPIRSRAESGAPLIDELFALARETARHPLLAYINADIILLEDFLPAVVKVREKFERFLMVGNRWDLMVNERLAFDEDGIEQLYRHLHDDGQRHPPMGSDYFVYRKDQFQNIPAFALGRAGWDNWMIYKGRHERIPVIDASAAVTAVHQDHDYGHLVGGEPHYRHPESLHNIELAGGYETVFRLRDADWLMSTNRLHKKKLSEWEWPRKIEADLISAFGAGTTARITRMIFHPGHAFSYLRQKLSERGQPNSPEAGDREVST